MSPAAAIVSISAGDFLMITQAALRGAAWRASRGCGRGPRRRRACRRSAAAGRAPRSSRSAARSARGRSSSRLLDRLGLVVVALDERRPSLVADALVLGRVEVHVVDVAVRRRRRRPERRWTTLVVGASISSAAVSRRPSSLERLVERVGLRDRAREAVEQEAVVRPRPRSRSRIISMTSSSGTRSPASMYSAACLPSSVSFARVLAQHVAGGDVGQVEVLAQARGLRALAGAGRAEEDQVQLAHGRVSLLQEALVVAHHQLRLELLHRVQRHADHDQDRRAAEEEVRATSG